MNRKFYKGRDWLYQKYIIEKLSLAETGELCGVGGGTIGQWLIRYGIRIRGSSEVKRGKTYEEICGKKKGKKLRRIRRKRFKGQSSSLKNKTYEEIHGKEKAEKLRKQRSETKKEYFRHNVSPLKNKTYEEIHGVKKAKELRESRRRVSERRITENPDMFKKENNSNWRGGISLNPYGEEFNDELKFCIRDRDENICQFCGFNKGHPDSRSCPVHHINYDKKDNRERNLLALCISCNNRANFDRKKWELCFTVLQEIRHLTYPIGGI